MQSTNHERIEYGCKRAEHEQTDRQRRVLRTFRFSSFSAGNDATIALSPNSTDNAVKITINNVDADNPTNASTFPAEPESFKKFEKRFVEIR